MTTNQADVQQRSSQGPAVATPRPYEKPVLKTLDVGATRGKPINVPLETSTSVGS